MSPRAHGEMPTSHGPMGTSRSRKADKMFRARKLTANHFLPPAPNDFRLEFSPVNVVHGVFYGAVLEVKKIILKNNRPDFFCTAKNDGKKTRTTSGT